MIQLHKVHVFFDNDSGETISCNEYKNCHLPTMADLINFINRSTGYLFFEEEFKVYVVEKDSHHYLEAIDVLHDDDSGENLGCCIHFSVN
jgi:hypothetical protein